MERETASPEPVPRHWQQAFSGPPEPAYIVTDRPIVDRYVGDDPLGWVHRALADGPRYAMDLAAAAERNGIWRRLLYSALTSPTVRRYEVGGRRVVALVDTPRR